MGHQENAAACWLGTTLADEQARHHRGLVRLEMRLWRGIGGIQTGLVDTAAD